MKSDGAASERIDELAEYFGTFWHLDWAVHIDPAGRFVYFDNPKVATGTIKRSLHAQADPYMDLDQVSEHARYLSPLKRPANFSPDELEALLWGPDVLRVGFVREPLSRALSAYRDKIANIEAMALLGMLLETPPTTKRDQTLHRPAANRKASRQAVLSALGRDPDDWQQDISFVDFLRALDVSNGREANMHWRPQHLNLPVEKVEFDFIGRFERLNEDLGQLLAKFGEGVVEEQRSYSTGAAKSAADIDDPEIIALVRRIYAKDYDLFGY